MKFPQERAVTCALDSAQKSWTSQNIVTLTRSSYASSRAARLYPKSLSDPQGNGQTSEIHPMDLLLALTRTDRQVGFRPLRMVHHLAGIKLPCCSVVDKETLP